MKNDWLRYGKILAALWLVVFGYACNDDRDVFGEYRPSEVICFTASITADGQAVHSRGEVPYMSILEEKWELEGKSSDASRGAALSTLNGLEVGVFGNAYKVNAEGVVTENNAIMSNKQFAFINNEDLKSSGEPVFWSGVDDASTLRVYSYAPYIAQTTSNFVFTTKDGEPVITYTVPAEVASQTDIITSDMKEVPGDYNQFIPLTYNHILTGIRFKAGFDCLVKSISLQKVFGKGTYALSGTWSNQTEQTNYSISYTEAKSSTTGSMITDGTSILMMIPQQLPADAKVVLTYMENGTDKTIEASLKGLKWEPGKLITYTINKEASSDSYVYFDLHAGNVVITPTSYKGYVYVNGISTEVTKTFAASEQSNYKYYVYQSTHENKTSTGYETTLNVGTCRIPSYAPVTYNDQFWSEYITNNKVVEDVIENWDTKTGIDTDADDDKINSGAYADKTSLA